MNEYKTTSLTISSISYNLMRTSAIGISITNMLYHSNQNTPLSIIIGFILGFVPIAIFLKIMNNNKNLNILEINNNSFGKTIGNIINIIISIYIIIFISITMWNLTDFLYTQFLNKTPTLIIGIAFLIPIVYINLKGINAIGKASLVLFYINIITLIFITIALFTKIDITNFLPLNNNITNILNGSSNYICYNILPIFILTIIPINKLRDDKNYNKHIKLMYIISTIEILIITILIIGLFGINLAKTFAYPEYHILKRISIFNMFERTEAVLSLTWVCGFFITISTGIYFTKESFKKAFKYKDKKNILTIIISIIILFLSEIIFKNHTQAFNFLLKIFPLITYIFLLIIPILILIKQKKKN